jgi:23S rRNA (uracil1939-C5)-methyltransferase
VPVDAPVRLDKMAAGGDAIGRLGDGRVVFVPGGLPGEVVSIELTQSKKDFARASITAILEPSAHRRVEPCPHRVRGCGGCDWMHADPAAQVAMKVDVVRDALRRTARINDSEVTIGGAVPPTRYRTTLRLATATATAAGGRLGLRSARSHDVVALDECPVADDALADLVRSARSTHGEVQARVSAATGARSLWAIDGGTVYGPDDVLIGPEAALVERVGDVDLSVSAASFFQSGPSAAALLVQRVSAMIDETMDETMDGRGSERGRGRHSDYHLLDAYGGIGLFAATVPASRVTLVEANGAACADATQNLAGRGATIHHMPMEGWRPEPVDVVIADPARAGLGPSVAAALAATKASLIVLVSCDPVSMARDVAAFATSGYVGRRYEVLDLFPNTHHVEVISCLIPERNFR